MALTILFNGVTYSIPQVGDESWGEALTSYFVAIPQGALQKTGGSFTLSANVNFGATYGLLSAYFSTRTALPSTVGLVRLAVSDSIGWKNNAGGGNLLLAVNGSDQLTFNGSAIYPGGITALTGDVTATGPGSVAATVAAIGGTSVGGNTTGVRIGAGTQSTGVILQAFQSGTAPAILQLNGTSNTSAIDSGRINFSNTLTSTIEGIFAQITGAPSTATSGSMSLKTRASGAAGSEAFSTCLSLDSIGNVNVPKLTISQVVVTDSSKNLASIAYGSSPVASAFSLWDANSNLSANSMLEGYATTATGGITTTLTVASAQQQFFTGSSTQTVLLPVTSTLALGQRFRIVNNSSGAVTVQSSGANTIQAMGANSVLVVNCISLSGTGTASWSAQYSVEAGGSVTSVALSVPGTSIFGVSGSPVTTSGTLGLTTTGTSGGLLYFSSTSAVSSSALLTASQLIVGGGAGTTPATLAAGSQYQVLVMGASNPGYGQVNLAQSAAVTGVLPNANTTAASANTASTIVARDSSGNFTAGTITAALTGNATTATTATNATNTAITDDTTTNATMYPTWVTAATGNLPQKVSSTKLSFNPSTGVLTSTSFTGAGTGLTGTAASLTAGNVTTNANLTGVITSSGNATSIASQTGIGTTFVVQTSPQISTGLGIGTAAVASRGLKLGLTTLTGTSQIMVEATGTFSSAATAGGYGYYMDATTAAASYTMTALYQFYASSQSKGASSTITTQYGFYSEALTAGATNYAFFSAGTVNSQFGVLNNIIGTDGSGDAAAGNVGEYFETLQTTATNVTTSSTYQDIGSGLPLTKGDWDLSLMAFFQLNGAVATGAIEGFFGTVTGNNTTGRLLYTNYMSNLPPTSVSPASVVIASYRVKIASDTTYYAKVAATFSAGNIQFQGRASARRIR